MITLSSGTACDSKLGSSTKLAQFGVGVDVVVAVAVGTGVHVLVGGSVAVDDGSGLSVAMVVGVTSCVAVLDGSGD